MILQYKGFNENWCYTEADTIVWANVWVGKETRDYRKGGVRHNLYLEERKEQKGEDDIFDLNYTREMHNAVDKLIQSETNCKDDIVYLVDGRFDELENVCVVTLERSDKPITYVFSGKSKVAYILNSSGKTVQRIA